MKPISISTCVFQIRKMQGNIIDQIVRTTILYDNGEVWWKDSDEYEWTQLTNLPHES